MTARPHRWKLSWPGNFCLDCGLDDPNEGPDALVACPACGPDRTEAQEDCPRCLGTGCIPNPDLVVPPCPPPGHVVGCRGKGEDPHCDSCGHCEFETGPCICYAR